MNMIMLNIQNSGLSMLTRETKDNNIRDTPATEIDLICSFLYELMYTISSTTRHNIPQTRRNIGEAYPMLREKRFRESIINVIEANLLITVIVSVANPIMNLLSTPQGDRLPFLCSLRYYIFFVIFFVNISLPAFINSERYLYGTVQKDSKVH